MASLSGLFSRVGRGATAVGRGLYRAAPTIRRVTAGGAAAFQNRRPLEDIRVEEETAKRDRLTELGLERQAQLDEMARRSQEQSMRLAEEQSQRAAASESRAAETFARQPKTPQEEIQLERERAAALAPIEQEKMVREAQGRGYTPEFTPRFGQEPSSVPELAKLGVEQTTPLPPEVKLTPPRDYAGELKLRLENQLEVAKTRAESARDAQEAIQARFEASLLQRKLDAIQRGKEFDEREYNAAYRAALSKLAETHEFTPTPDGKFWSELTLEEQSKMAQAVADAQMAAAPVTPYFGPPATTSAGAGATGTPRSSQIPSNPFRQQQTTR